MSATARFDLKMAPEDKEMAARGAALAGTSMASFVRFAIRAQAQELIDREARITLSQSDFSHLVAALNEPFKPNAALAGALAAARKLKRA